ncbi:MAG: hypothetical protein ACOH5I_19690 [Oligoflexus sp.]
MMRTILLLMLALLNSAWTDRVQLTNKYGNDGTDKDPIYEKNFGYLFCETKEDARRARMGEIDWRRSVSDDYCRFKHRNSDDTWRSGWERSRLFRGCKNQLNMFGNAVYRCYDSTKDPAILAFEQQLNQTKADEYEDWLLAYQAKQKELLARAEELTGIEDMDAEIEAAKKQEERLQAEQQKLLLEAEEAKKSTEGFMEEFEATEKTLNVLATRFDTDFENLSKTLQNQSQLEREAESVRQSIRARLAEGRNNWQVVQALKQEWRDKLSSNTATLCEDRSSIWALEASRSQVAYMNQLLSSLETKWEILQFPRSFASTKADLRKKIDSLRKISESRDFIFDEFYDSLTSASPLCKSVPKLRNELGLAGVSAELIHRAEQAGSLAASIREKFAELEAGALADERQDIAAIKIKGLHTTLVQYIYEGRVGEARNLADSIFTDIDQIVAEAELSPGSQQMKRLREEVEKIKPSLNRESNRVLSVSSARGVLNYKVNSVYNLLLTCELKARQSAEFKEIWAIKKTDIYQELNTRPRSRIPVPMFQDWEELAQYELLLDRLENVLRYIVEEKK